MTFLFLPIYYHTTYCSSQGQLRYEIIGDYPAPSFFQIKEDDGQITVKNDLKTDNLKSTQYDVSIGEHYTL